MFEIAQLLEDEKHDQIYYEVENGQLLSVDKKRFSFKDLQEDNFYIRTEDKPVIELGRDANAV